MHTQPQRYEVELGHVALPLLHILDQEMHDLLMDLLEKPNRRPIESQRAHVANAIVVLCRQLTDDLRRYSYLCYLEDEGLDVDLSEDDLDF
jgi:hypothetical protein